MNSQQESLQAFYSIPSNTDKGDLCSRDLSDAGDGDTYDNQSATTTFGNPTLARDFVYPRSNPRHDTILDFDSVGTLPVTVSNPACTSHLQKGPTILYHVHEDDSMQSVIYFEKRDQETQAASKEIQGFFQSLQKSVLNAGSKGNIKTRLLSDGTRESITAECIRQSFDECGAPYNLEYVERKETFDDLTKIFTASDQFNANSTPTIVLEVSLQKLEPVDDILTNEIRTQKLYLPFINHDNGVSESIDSIQDARPVMLEIDKRIAHPMSTDNTTSVEGFIDGLTGGTGVYKNHRVTTISPFTPKYILDRQECFGLCLQRVRGIRQRWRSLD
ncbi:uncharacterized protein IL334_002143 [Kwoniella shivajii]|uniref:Uncharacterized protein n=1 Tax=Kwoniella shivajii TaxID=564305 RepID=A0ABZ1CTW7_9TREE|nr:hypothetical protein IL334_002143 [Kwoniella shivajii]